MNLNQSGHALDAPGCPHGPGNTPITRTWWANAAGHSRHIEPDAVASAGIHGKAASQLLIVHQLGSAAVMFKQATVRLHRQTLANQKKFELTTKRVPLAVVEALTYNLVCFARVSWIVA